MQVSGMLPMATATFALGCLAIHIKRQHALHTTRILIALLAIVALAYIVANALIHPEAEADEYDLLTVLERSL